jgi:hypothetical protein
LRLSGVSFVFAMMMVTWAVLRKGMLRARLADWYQLCFGEIGDSIAAV